jgi:hypothetical protein
VVVYFSTATIRRSRGASWSIIAPPFRELHLGDSIQIKEGVMAIVLARFTPSGQNGDEVHYIVQTNISTNEAQTSE